MAVLRLRGISKGATAVTALLIGGSLCVPLWMSCVALELDSPISLEQVAHIRRAGVFLLASWLLIQPVASSTLRPRLFPKSTGWRKMFQFAGLTAASAVVSIGVGVLIDGFAEERWRRVALSLFG